MTSGVMESTATCCQGARMSTTPTLPAGVRYLQVVSGLLAVASLVLPALPAVGAAAFALLVYQDPALPGDFSGEAASYVRLTHAVLGAVMAGWFVTMLVLAPLVATSRRVWLAVATGLAVWFVPDTLYSLASGYWSNAVLNLAVLALLLPALVALRPRPSGSSALDRARQPLSRR